MTSTAWARHGRSPCRPTACRPLPPHGRSSAHPAPAPPPLSSSSSMIFTVSRKMRPEVGNSATWRGPDDPAGEATREKTLRNRRFRASPQTTARQPFRSARQANGRKQGHPRTFSRARAPPAVRSTAAAAAPPSSLAPTAAARCATPSTRCAMQMGARWALLGRQAARALVANLACTAVEDCIVFD